MSPWCAARSKRRPAACRYYYGCLPLSGCCGPRLAGQTAFTAGWVSPVAGDSLASGAVPAIQARRMGPLWISRISGALAARVLGFGAGSRSVVAKSSSCVRRLGQGRHCAKYRFPDLRDGSHLACCETLHERDWLMVLWLSRASRTLSCLPGIRSEEPRCYRYRSASSFCCWAGGYSAGRGNHRMHCREPSSRPGMGDLTEPPEFNFASIQQAEDYRATKADNSIGEHFEFLRKSVTFVREAPLVGHGTGSIADLFRRSAIGQTGATA